MARVVGTERPTHVPFSSTATVHANLWLSRNAVAVKRQSWVPLLVPTGAGGKSALTTSACTVLALALADVPLRAFVPVPRTVTSKSTEIFFVALIAGRVHVGESKVASSSVPSDTDQAFVYASYRPPVNVLDKTTVVPSSPLAIALITTTGGVATGSCTTASVVALPLGDHDAAVPTAFFALNCASYCVPPESPVRVSTPPVVDRVVQVRVPTRRQRQSYPVIAEPPSSGAVASHRTCRLPPVADGAAPRAGAVAAFVLPVPLGDQSSAVPTAFFALNCASYCVPPESPVRVSTPPVVDRVVHDSAPTWRQRQS